MGTCFSLVQRCFERYNHVKTNPLLQAGAIIYDGQGWDALADAIANFQETNTDPNANVLPTFNVQAGGTQVALLMVFYNKPTPPPGLFDRFLHIPSVQNTVTTRSFLDFVLSNPSNPEANLR